MVDTAIEPLIADSRPDVPREDEDGGEVDESGLVKPGRFMWFLTFCAGVSGLLFGYEYVLLSQPCFLRMAKVECFDT